MYVNNIHQCMDSVKNRKPPHYTNSRLITKV